MLRTVAERISKLETLSAIKFALLFQINYGKFFKTNDKQRLRTLSSF